MDAVRIYFFVLDVSYWEKKSILDGKPALNEKN